MTDAYKGDILTRIITAVPAIVLALLCTWYGGAAFTALVIFAGLLLVYEGWTLARSRADSRVSIAPLVVLSLVLVLAVWLVSLGLLVALLMIVGVGLLTLAWSTLTGRGFLFVAFLIWLIVPLTIMLWVRDDAQWGLITVVALFAVSWLSDTGAYCAGRLIRGPRLAPRLSPNKTWAGLMGGMIGGIIAAIIIGLWVIGYMGISVSLTSLAIMGALSAVLGQTGDIVESALKRWAGVKDSGKIMPGHGGLFDRVDGLLFVTLGAGLIALWRFKEPPVSGILLWP
ncbi:MAG: phosphatidate cytidylyltransferase [Parvularculales bacterium]